MIEFFFEIQNGCRAIYSKYMRKFLQQTAQNNRRNWKTKCVHVYNCKDLNNFFYHIEEILFRELENNSFP